MRKRLDGLADGPAGAGAAAGAAVAGVAAADARAAAGAGAATGAGGGAGAGAATGTSAAAGTGVPAEAGTAGTRAQPGLPGHPDRIARRYQLKAAVFGPPGLRTLGRTAPPSGGVGGPGAGGLSGPPATGPGTLHPGAQRPGQHRSGRPGTVLPDPADPGPPLPRVVTGQVLDASPQILIIGTARGEERFALTADARAWRGERTTPVTIRAGDHVVVRRHHSGREVADRIWANIGRVTGTIAQRHGRTLLVDEGSGSHQAVVIAKRAAGRIQVRFPRLEPGYLVDLIGIRHDGYLEGLVPATSQPTYRADHVPTPPLVNGHVPAAISGAGMWHEPGDEPDGLTGAAYPAVDPQNATGLAAGSGCVSLPYLSVGSLLRVRNDCTGLSQLLPVLGPADVARMFCDRSVSCGPSPRGRIVDLTVTSFVELGGELDEGNVNVTIEIGA